MKTILITGINGYLGSHLAKALSIDYNVVGLEYSLENLFRIADCNYKVYAAKDGITDDIFTEQTIDAIVHTATFYGRNNEDYLQMFEANLQSPVRLLNLAIKNGCKFFINTDTVLERFVSTYALTKRHFQEWLFIRRNEIKVINMQLEHFYGPNASPTNFITAMINRLKNNESHIDLTLGEQQRDFVYIDDVVSAYQTIIENVSQLPDTYSEFQVATQQLTSIKQLMEMLKEITGSTTQLNFGAVSYRENELMYSESDNSSLVNLGWAPKYTIIEGLQLTFSNSN